MYAVFIACNDPYVAKSIVALKGFEKYHPIGFHQFILGSKFSPASHSLASKYNIQLIEIDLSRDFAGHTGSYPLECFYHLYAYKVLNYDYLVNIEADFYTNKKLKIDYSQIHYLAGTSHDSREIAQFPCLARDRLKIEETFKVATFEGNRLLGGFRIYNTKGLTAIHFYERILRYYQESLVAGIPRRGDDSLLVLYQILHPEHITLLPSNNHVIFYHDLETVDEVTLFHFVGKRKYWDEVSPKIDTDRYFRNKAIQFLYNTFPLPFIEEYFPDLYVNINSGDKLTFWYWNEISNFGDQLTPYVLNRFCDSKHYECKFNHRPTPRILACGSIMRLCHSDAIVYGAGIRDRDQVVEPGLMKIVRGPLTRQRIVELGGYCPPVYGDLGLLLPRYYHPKHQIKFKLGIIPHYLHYEKACKQFTDPEVTVINLLNSVEDVIDRLLECEMTVSSSLHGLIISDAYQIPNKWIYFDNEIRGDNTKYYDYFQSVKRVDQTYIQSSLPVSEIIKSITPVNITFDSNTLADNMFFDSKGIKPYTRYLWRRYIGTTEWIAYKPHWTLKDTTITSLRPTRLTRRSVDNPTKPWIEKRAIPENYSVQVLGEELNYFIIRFWQ